MAITSPILRSAAVLAALSWLSVTSATCYRPDGLAVDDTYQPCNGSAPVSMCCHTGSSNNNGDACGTGSQYGLCGVTGTQLWREACTDPTWKSPACLNFCTTGSAASEDSMITACNDGTYCCGQNNATCCNDHDGFFIVNNPAGLTPISTSTSTSAPSSTSSAKTSSTNAPTRTTTTPSAFPTSSQTSQKSGLSMGARAGIGIGAAVGALGVFAPLACLLWRWKRKSELDDCGEAEKPNPVDVERSELERASSEPDLEGSVEEEPRGRAIYRRGDFPRTSRAELPV